MRKNFLRFVPLAVASALFPVAVLSAASSPPTSSTATGVYTPDQARQGGLLYAQRCAMCHGANLEGTYEISPLKGRFLTNWNHAPLGRLFDYVSRAMPQMAPGSLTRDENAAIVAYLLQVNGMPAGTKPMANDAQALDAIMIEQPKH